ncbi:AAA family ATPase [Leeuwenhoekiella sp. A2]|uniref:AAA family ATPase n=1 Tax=Leeuwenhoekiella sp. A2 TaxID=3141460 RepID=UPI003A80FBA6
MKILKIQFQNINSLKGEHVIDFTKEPFPQNSLFAITGPTGSGKSTILDVIALALFNQVPRIGKISKDKDIIKKGAILTRNQKEAYAKIAYSCKNGNYESTWSISTNRNDNLRDYEMQIQDLDSDKLLDLKKSDVPSKNEELIGLNYNQFIKSVLLAQGEFAQFLKVDKAERGELLEKITGTWIYREIGRKTYEKHKQVSKEIEQQQQQIAIITTKLLEADSKTQLKNELETWQKSLENEQKSVKSLEKQLALKKQLANLKEELAQVTAGKAMSEKALFNFQEANGKVLAGHEKVYEQAEKLNQWQTAKNELKSFNEEREKLNENRVKNIKNLDKCVEDVSAFIASPVSYENLSEKIDSFREKVTALRDDLFKKGELKKSLLQALTSETRDLEIDLNQDLDLVGEKLNLQSQTISQELKILQQQIQLTKDQNPETEKNRLKRLEKLALEAKNLTENINRLQTDIASAKAEKEQFLPELKSLPAQIEHAAMHVKLQQTQLEKLRQQEKYEARIASLEQSRSELEDGEPCPLCGALHHPFAVHTPDLKNELANEINKAESDLKEAQRNFTQSETRIAFLKDQSKKIDNKLIHLNKDHESLKEKFKQEYSTHFKENENWLEVIEQVESKLQALDSYEKALRKKSALDASKPLLNELKSVEKDGKALKTDYKNLYGGNNINKDCQDFHNTFITYRENQTAITKAIEDLILKINTKTRAFDEITADLEVFIAQKEINSLDDAMRLLLPNATYNALREERENLKNKISAQAASLKTLQKQHTILEEQDTTQAEIELQEKLRESHKNQEILNTQCEHNRRLLKNEDENLTELNRLKGTITDKEKAIKRWRLLNELIGDSTGKRFNEFAQDLTLSQLIQLANKRLESLSDRYRIDKPLEDEDDSLMAIDDHMGGQRRSVKTLSGGETFILSLSMALALSDLASKNVEINSLFIDEGFGTLDPEMLDQTLDTLEKLQAESSKTIGIISHVDSLKERIGTQIQLTRNGQGYSSLEIVQH